MIQLRGLPASLRANAEWCVEVARLNGIPVTITSTLRPLDQQRRLRENFERCVAAGRYPSNFSFGGGMSCRYPANRPGDSAHNYGLAWDSVVPTKDQESWNYIRRYAGWEVPPNDQIHAEVPGWRQYIR